MTVVLQNKSVAGSSYRRLWRHREEGCGARRQLLRRQKLRIKEARTALLQVESIIGPHRYSYCNAAEPTVLHVIEKAAYLCVCVEYFSGPRPVDFSVFE